MTRLRLLISGRVQGVGFRAYVAREGLSRGLSGWVRNLRDGRVETEFVGPRAVVEDMQGACRRGPYGSHVTLVETAPAGLDSLPATFDVRRDG